MAENLCRFFIFFLLALCPTLSNQLPYILFSNLVWTKTINRIWYIEWWKYGALNKEQEASHASASLHLRLDLYRRLIKMHIRKRSAHQLAEIAGQWWLGCFIRTDQGKEAYLPLWVVIEGSIEETYTFTTNLCYFQILLSFSVCAWVCMCVL